VQPRDRLSRARFSRFQGIPANKCPDTASRCSAAGRIANEAPAKPSWAARADCNRRPPTQRSFPEPTTPSVPAGGPIPISRESRFWDPPSRKCDASLRNRTKTAIFRCCRAARRLPPEPAMGLAVGITVALFASRLLSGLLFGVERSDPVDLCDVRTRAARGRRRGRLVAGPSRDAGRPADDPAGAVAVLP